MNKGSINIFMTRSLKIPHSHRKMKLEEKNKFLIKNLRFDRAEIKRIQLISNKEKRFVEAAKLQMQKFNAINGDVTAWIAGFSSESSVRNVFGSHFELRKKIIKMPIIKFTGIKFSTNDIIRQVRIPNEINVDLSEEIGIHIGDGSLFIAKDKKWNSYSYSLSGNLREELQYYEDFVLPLYKKLFNLEANLLKNKLKNECRFTLKSRALFDFKNKILQLQVGEKNSIQIPKQIRKNAELLEACIRGLIDTDGTLNASRKGSLHLTLSTSSRPLFYDLKRSFSFLKFNYTYHKKDLKSFEFSFDTANSLKFINEIGFHNISQNSKYLLWKEFGFSPTRIHTEERLGALKGSIEFEDLVKLSEKRKARSGGISEL